MGAEHLSTTNAGGIHTEKNLQSPLKSTDNRRRDSLTFGIESQRTTKPDITSTLFVPTSMGSLLFKLVCEQERLLTKNSENSIKILEQAGIPLLNCFIHKFPLHDGCPKNDSCTICSNKCVKCCTKGAVYRIFCVDCQRLITGDKGYIEGQNIPTYIGESSRPIRERISEHVNYFRNWRSESIMIQHWMQSHGTELKCPEFKFELVGSFSDPLRRQLSEAIHINEFGTLNNKHEFGVNELQR